MDHERWALCVQSECINMILWFPLHGGDGNGRTLHYREHEELNFCGDVYVGLSFCDMAITVPHFIFLCLIYDGHLRPLYYSFCLYVWIYSLTCSFRVFYPYKTCFGCLLSRSNNTPKVPKDFNSSFLSTVGLNFPWCFCCVFTLLLRQKGTKRMICLCWFEKIMEVLRQGNQSQR